MNVSCVASGKITDKRDRDRASYNATDTLCERLSKIDGMTSISYNINKENTNVILGKKTVCIWGRSYIEDTIHLLSYPDFTPQGTGITYQISPQSFYQVNPEADRKTLQHSLGICRADRKGKCGISTAESEQYHFSSLSGLKRYMVLR